MERGREGRRAGGGGGLVHAPRRPRTGFKDAAGACAPVVLCVSIPLQILILLHARHLSLSAHLDLRAPLLAVRWTESWWLSAAVALRSRILVSKWCGAGVVLGGRLSLQKKPRRQQIAE